MTPKSAGSDDWLSAPVGGSAAKTEDKPGAGTPLTVDNATSTSRTSTGGSTGRSVYPGGVSTSPASSAPLDPGPATSIGLGASGTSASSTQSSLKSSARRPTSRGPRRAKLQIRHIDPWSTLKLSLVVSIVFFFVWMVAVGVLYWVLSMLGVWDAINGGWSEYGSKSAILTPKVVLGGAAIIGAINIILFTALATIGSYIYNLCADLAGGLEITLAERR